MAEKIIKTERLVLRSLVMADVEEQARLIADYEVSKWLTVVPHPYGLADARRFIGEIAGEWDLGIEIDGSIAGVVGISGGLGYWLGRPYWGQGFMAEATKAMAAVWFEAGNECLSSGYFIGNAASAAILDRLGFVKGAVVKQHSRARRAEVDLQQVSLSRADWQAQNG